MTYKTTVSLIVLCSAFGLLLGSFVSNRTLPLSASDRQLIRTTLPFLDLTTLSRTSSDVQHAILNLIQSHPNPSLVTARGDQTKNTLRISDIPNLPFYSQFADISSPKWQKVSCGIASLAMVIDHYSDKTVDPDELLESGLKNGAYIETAGWSHQGLINLATTYELTGETVGLSHLSMTEAFSHLTEATKIGPVIASVHYTFEPTNPIPHLVVVRGVADGQVYYSDPAEPNGNRSIGAEKFKSAWKKRYIALYHE